MADQAKLNYWEECVAEAAEKCGAALTREQLSAIAASVETGHECYGMAFYQPPASDRISVIESEWKAKLDRLQREFDAYRGNAESAVKRALKQRHDAHVTIEAHGEVFRHGGSSEQIL